MEITNKEELFKVIADLQGGMATMQETIDKMSPIEKEGEEIKPNEEEENKGNEEAPPTEEEVNEIDAMLQEK